MKAISFYTEEINFNLKDKNAIKRWIKKVFEENQKSSFEINYIFCSDEYLLKVNKEYLNHDYYTDIITFDNSESEKQIESDVFVSIDRVRENAEKLKTTFEEELRRVLIHGVLHLVGYKDKTEAQEKEMRLKEDYCLSLYEK